MSPDLPTVILLGAYVVLGTLIAMPSLAALHGRRRSRECSEFAGALVEFASTVRREGRCLTIDDEFLRRARKLGVPELMSFEYLCELPHPDPVVLADAAQRLALRLKRRVAFARKMLARTTSGRRRAALAAAAPAFALLLLGASGVVLPFGAFMMLMLLEALGCWLLWQLARVEV